MRIASIGLGLGLGYSSENGLPKSVLEVSKSGAMMMIYFLNNICMQLFLKFCIVYLLI